MNTGIYTTKKLEKLLKKVIQKEEELESGIFGKWNATVFYTTNKKCFLFTNAETKYNIILMDIRAAQYSKLGVLFIDTLFEQLLFDGILVDYHLLASEIGKLHFLPTENDKRTTGFQNQRLQDLTWWEDELAKFDSLIIKEVTHRLNTNLIRSDPNKRRSEYTTPIKWVKKMLNTKG